MQLPLGLTRDALEAATAEPDPESLAAGARLRQRFGSDLAAAALTQVALRRAAQAKFGARAATMFFTRDGLEQATRPGVAARHARRLADAGVRAVTDLGCGIGSDAMAFAEAGLDVTAVEIDPATAAVAEANLGGRGTVLVEDATRVRRDADPTGQTGYFCDPSRRTSAGRVWRVEDFSPPWSYALDLLTQPHVAGIKLGPALPHALIPDGAEAEWISQAGDTVEVCLWAGGTAQAGAKSATLLPAVGPRPFATAAPLARLVVAGAQPSVGVSEPRRFVFEPDGAVIRAGGIAQVAELLGAHLLDPAIAYLTADDYSPTPFATAFEVLEVLPYREKSLRSWVRSHQVGTLEIKKRGIDVDPAALRRRLAPRGPERATLIITRIPGSAVVLVTRRVTVA
jgi:THUMP domain-like/Methyltransferase domain